MENVGMVLASVLALVLAIVFGYFTNSVIFGIIVFIISAGYLFGKWMEAGVPYDIHDIKKKLDDKE